MPATTGLGDTDNNVEVGYFPLYDNEPFKTLIFWRQDNTFGHKLTYVKINNNAAINMYYYIDNAFGNAGWIDERFKTIVINEPEGYTLDESFITWLKANATKQQ